MLKKKLMTLLTAVMLAGSIMSFNGCAAGKHEPLPEPVYGRDIVQLAKDVPAPFEGTLFSNFYLQKYLEWKCTDQGKC